MKEGFEMKRALAWIAVLNVFFCNLFELGTAIADYDPDLVYTKAGIVSGFDFENDLVFVSEATGNEWSFYGIEDWMVGDIAIMTIFDIGSESIYDDEIIDVTYGGHIDDLIRVYAMVLTQTH